MVIDRGGKFLDDAASLRAIIAQMPESLREEYEGYGALSLEAAFPNRRMVVYTLLEGQPTRIVNLVFGDLDVSRREGASMEITHDGETLSVGMRPTKLRGRDLFLQVPQRFELKWSGKSTETHGVQFVPHYAVLIKTRSKEFHQVEGHTYCATLNKFRERFPGLNIRY